MVPYYFPSRQFLCNYIVWYAVIILVCFCSLTHLIRRFINGLNPLQLGGIKNKNLAYPPLTVKDSFSGCIRKVTDNGIVYDLSKPIEEKDVGLGCPLANACPNCVFGYCKMDQRPFVCVCQFGWTGDNCDRRK